MELRTGGTAAHGGRAARGLAAEIGGELLEGVVD
jgi:hypothetical protein